MHNHATIKGFRKSRADWIEILVKNPNNTAAAENIVKINAKLELLDTLRFAEGDYSEVRD